MPINDLMHYEGDPIYYDDAFNWMLETHLRWLRERPETVVYPVDEFAAYKYQGDLFAYLTELGKSPQYHRLLMRLNAMASPQDFGPQTQSLLIVPDQYIEQLLARYRTITKKIA
jgi:hypothetical protein